MNPYEILGVAPTAGPDEIEAAYRAQLRAWHPDLHQVDGPAAVAEAEARTRALNEAIARVRAGWRPGPTAGGAGVHPPGWGPPPADRDWFGNPVDGHRQPVPCPFCGQPFDHLREYEVHLAHAHQVRDLLDRGTRTGPNVVLRGLGALRYVPTWLAVLVTFVLLMVLPLVLFPVPLGFLALVLWAQTSRLFRPPRTTARRATRS